MSAGPGGREWRSASRRAGRAAGSGARTEPDPRPLRDSVDEVVRSLRGTSARSLAGVFSRWEEAVGPQIAAHAEPAALVDGCLVVEVDHPTWATQLRFLETDLLTRLRDVAGVDEVARIELRVRRPLGPLEAPVAPPLRHTPAVDLEHRENGLERSSGSGDPRGPDRFRRDLHHPERSRLGEGRERQVHRVRRVSHPGPGGPGPRAQAARHVHRLDRARRAAPPDLGGRRQLGRRGDGRLLPAASSSCSRPTAAAGSTTTVAAFRSTPTRPAPTRARARSRSCSPCCTPAASSAAAATRSPAGCTASASRSSTRCRSGSVIEVDKDGIALPPGVRQGRQAPGQAGGRRPTPPRGRTRHHRHLLAGPHRLQLGGHRVPRPDRARAAADDGLPQQGPGDPVHRRAARPRAERSPTSTRAASSTS